MNEDDAIRYVEAIESAIELSQAQLAAASRSLFEIQRERIICLHLPGLEWEYKGGASIRLSKKSHRKAVPVFEFVGGWHVSDSYCVRTFEIHHNYVALDESIELFVSDEELRLAAGSLEALIDFVRNRDLQVDWSYIEHEIARNEKAIEEANHNIETLATLLEKTKVAK